MTSNNLLANTIDMPSSQVSGLDLIVPGDPDASYIVRKLEDTQTVGISMPWLSPQLSPEKITAVRDWISTMQPPAETQQPTLASIQLNVFNISCAIGGCHDNTSKSFGLDLSDGNSFAGMVNISSSQSPLSKIVKPGDAKNSYLIKKLEGTGAGSTMPQGQQPLPQETINEIRNWINGL